MEGNGIKKISFDMKFYDKINSGAKVRTARPEAKADVGEIVQIFDKLYVITERRIYPFLRLINETYTEEGFDTSEEFSVELKRIYGDGVYSRHMYSHKFMPYNGEISDQIRGNGIKTCFGCSRGNLYTVPASWGGEFYCRRKNQCTGMWISAQKRIELPERCGLHGSD